MNFVSLSSQFSSSFQNYCNRVRFGVQDFLLSAMTLFSACNEQWLKELQIKQSVFEVKGNFSFL